MVQSTPLRLRVNLQDGETAFSYMSRLSARNGVSISTFGQDQDISFQKVLDGTAAAIQDLAWLGGVPAESLAKSSPVKLKNNRHEFCGEYFPAKVIRSPIVRGCPLCLREDAETSELRREWSMALRSHWMLPYVTVCIKHKHPLVELWNVKHPRIRYDISSRMEEVAHAVMFGELDQKPREPEAFDNWLENRLSLGAGELWLDDHALHAAATFCFLLGCALLRHAETVTPAQVRQDKYWVLYDAGYQVAREGELAIHHELNRLLELDADAKQGPKSIFPVLYDRLSRDYRDNPDFAPFQKILREHLLRSWPLGVGDDLLGEPVTERRLHSVITASREYGIDQRRLRKMLESASLITGSRPDKWTVFNAEAAAPFLRSMTRLLPAKAFAENLNMSRSQFDLIVEDGFLKPALETRDTKNIWDPKAGQEFLESILAGAEPQRQAQHGWEHIAKSAMRLKQRPGALIQAIQDGLILRIGKHMDFEGYASIYVYHNEVATALEQDQPNAMTLEVFAKAVGIRQPSYLNRLISKGHTPASQLKNPKTNAMQPYITAENAKQFHRKFCTLRTLSKATGQSWQKIAGSLAAADILPFSPNGEQYGKVYLKTDVEHVAFDKM